MPKEILLVTLPVALQLLLVSWMLWRYRQLKQHQDRLAALHHGFPFWRVAMCRASFHTTFWRRDAVEAMGLMIDEGSHVRFVGRWPGAAEDFDLRLDKATSMPHWHGNKTLRDGGLSWARFPSPAGELLVTSGAGARAWSSREDLTDILRSIYPKLVLPESAMKDFALEKNPRSKMAVTLFLLLTLLAFSDTFNPYEWPDAQLHELARRAALHVTAPLALFCVAGLGYSWLQRGGVPARESMVLALLLTVTMAIAAIPGAKRLDQWMGSSPAQWYPYRLVDASGRLEPIDDGLDLPALRQRTIMEYWAQFPIDHEVKVPLRRGGLGLWQLDHRLFDPPIDEFYELRAAKKTVRH